MTRNVVLVSGPSGCERDAFIRGAIDNRTDTRYYRVFEFMQKAASEDGEELSETNIDGVRDDLRIKWRTDAFNFIGNEINSSDVPYHIVSTTCIFDYPSGDRQEGITSQLFDVIKPNTVIAFIDDLLAIKKRLKEDARWHLMFRESGGEASLSTLARWRQASIDFLEKMAKSNKKLHCSPTGFVENFYIFARQHTKETFLSLIYENNKKYSIYLSYPITGADENRDDFEKLRTALSRCFIVFDPYTIKDWQIVYKYDEAIEQNKAQIEFDDFTIQTSEISSAIPAIRKQLVKRDLALIDNAEGVVVYHKKKEPSAGVMAEIVHAKSNGKPIFGFYPFDRPSPFMEYYISTGEMSTTFPSIEDLMAHLMMHYYSRGECG